METSVGRSRVQFADDVVPVVVPQPAQAGLPELLLLTRPVVATAEYSTRVSYARTGEASRTWREVRLTGGFATVPITSPVPPALRVRVDGYDGAAVGAVVTGLGPPDLAASLADSLVSALGPFVSACTGVEPSSLRHTVVLDAEVPGDVVAVEGTGGRGGHVVVVQTRLPNGALLRSVRAAVGGPEPARRLDLETVRPIELADSRQPFAVRLPWYGTRTGRFLVLAPGAARAQLGAVASNVYPTSEVTPLVDGTGILDVPDARLASVYRLVLWGSSGERLGAWRQVFRRGDPTRPVGTTALTREAVSEPDLTTLPGCRPRHLDGRPRGCGPQPAPSSRRGATRSSGEPRRRSSGRGRRSGPSPSSWASTPTTAVVQPRSAWSPC